LLFPHYPLEQGYLISGSEGIIPAMSEKMIAVIPGKTGFRVVSGRTTDKLLLQARETGAAGKPKRKNFLQK
jgi:hypothetical protein